LDELRAKKGPALPSAWKQATASPRALIQARMPRVAAFKRRRLLFGGVTISWKDKAVSVISIFVSALVGLQLLWVANATFGGLNDYITALVWGFGLHQLNETVRQAGPNAINSVLRSGRS